MLPGEHINGANTVGENIGDMGGIALGFDVPRSLHGCPAPVIDGLTGDQRAWCSAFDAKPGDELDRPPDERVHIW